MVTYAAQDTFSGQNQEVAGVIVLAEGGDDIGVQFMLLDAVRTALQVPVDHIQVFALAKTTQ